MTGSSGYGLQIDMPARDMAERAGELLVNILDLTEKRHVRNSCQAVVDFQGTPLEDRPNEEVPLKELGILGHHWATGMA